MALWAIRIAYVSLSAALAPCPVSNPFYHCATTSAFAAAQAFHESADGSIGVEAEAAKRVSEQARLMPALQATDYYRAI
jgi:hypothetical protein